MRDIQQLTRRVDDNQRVVVERDLLAREVAELRDQVVCLEQRKLCLTYDDLKPGGVLGSSVKEFTFFLDFDCNKAFLELINYGEQTFICSWRCNGDPMYSPYKHSSTMKWLAGCCPIGLVSEDMIGAGHCGSISDPVATALSKTLKRVSLWHGRRRRQRFPNRERVSIPGY